MICGIFALSGVIIGALLVALSVSDIKTAKKSKKLTGRAKADISDAGDTKQIAKQWENLLSYGSQIRQ